MSRPGVPPEDIALEATQSLLNEISMGGCVDRKHQCLVLLMMVLGSEDVGRCRMGEPIPRTYALLTPRMQLSFTVLRFRIQFLRDIKTFFGVSFKISPAHPSDDEAPSELVYSCYGVGYVNANRTLA
jgi:RNA 3'-terminal phosphate cyclase-like protein